MSQALALAAKGGRAVAPNPMVGAVLVKSGRVIGRGYHEFFGGPHAEVNALADARRRGHNPAGATLYVTLEPCRHHGKTPPCTQAIMNAGIGRVVCGSRDPFQKGRRGKIEFLTGSIAQKCHDLNKFFFTWVIKKRPYITVKIAISADGFVAGVDGQPVRITTKIQDKKVHQLRAIHQAILVGSNTVLTDDPHLGVRLVKGADPLRVLLDSKKRLPKSAKVFRDKNYWHVTKRLPFKTLFKQLADKGVASVLVEPGPTLYGFLKKAGLLDELIVFRGQKKIKRGLPLTF